MNETVKVLRDCEDIEIIGHGKADIAKIANRHRYFVLIRSLNTKPLLKAANLIQNSIVQIDIDPLSFS
jgi:primosomal protein N' (replication factor Y)